MSLTAYIEDSEAKLILVANRFAEDRDNGLVNLDAEYEKFSPLFKTTLANESRVLAGKAGVHEKAAFLALMQMLDH